MKPKKATRTWTEWVGFCYSPKEVIGFMRQHGVFPRIKTKREYLSFKGDYVKPKKIRVTITVEEVER